MPLKGLNYMSRFSKRIISFAAAALLAVQCLSASAAGVSAQSAAYESSIELLKNAVYRAGISEKDGAVLWNDGVGDLNFKFNMQSGGSYNLKIVWKPCGSGTDVAIGLLLDGEYPFEGIENTVLKRLWKNASDEPRRDSLGNEFAPEQIETGEFITSLVCDNSGAASEPYAFDIKAGEHTLTLRSPEQGIEISSLSLVPISESDDYKTVSRNYSLQKPDAEIINIHAESATDKTSRSIIPKSNNSDAGMTPSDAALSKINYIGGSTWQKPFESLSWTFEVKEAGYYYLNMRYRQSELINGQSVRRLKIDGSVPFSQAEELVFPYGSAWKYYTFEDDKEPYYFYLDKGTHTLTLEVNAGNKSEYFSRLKKIVNTLGDEYIKIVAITGETPDANRDYELFKQIPDFTETLTECRELLLKLAEDIDSESSDRSSQYTAAMKNTARVLAAMLKSPYSAQQYLSDYYTNYTSLGSWLYDMVNMPLALDELYIVPYGANAAEKSAGIIKRLVYGFKRFFVSFSSDYAISDSKEGSETVRLWVNWGQDQASVLNSLIKESFTEKTGISVKLEIVNTPLINGILSGNFPDVSLQMSRVDPVNLGIRGALSDLRQFDDCSDVLKSFQPGAETPYAYGNALYALPDTQSFFLMFYREDIFGSLGLSVPKTWTEFLEAATVIQRNNMSVYMPYTQITSSTTVNAGIGGLNVFPTLMTQSGLSLYNDELDGTALTSDKAVEIFEKWTEFYTDYDFYKEADFYNRFRVGSMPLGIAPYTMYMTLYSAAREIEGRWTVAEVPGTENGNNFVSGAGTGCGIIEKSKNKKAAWEFLKWWVSADTQERYSNNVESILGMIGRITTSNVEALSRLAWKPEVQKVINSEWALVKEVPEVPGSYYMTRCVDQAFWSVVNGTSRTKDALVKWSRVADDEIKRKIAEYR